MIQNTTAKAAAHFYSCLHLSCKTDRNVNYKSKCWFQVNIIRHFVYILKIHMRPCRLGSILSRNITGFSCSAKFFMSSATASSPE